VKTYKTLCGYSSVQLSAVQESEELVGELVS
jgi:hypothetical protein